jgi:hypothetical protein
MESATETILADAPQGISVKGEKFQDANISRRDILINICHLIRSRAIGMRGKPHPKQEQT